MTTLKISITSYMATIDCGDVIHIIAFPEGVVGDIVQGNNTYRTLCGKVTTEGWDAWVSDDLPADISTIDGCTHAKSVAEARCPECVAERSRRQKEYEEEME